jgi:hypothetical protein
MLCGRYDRQPLRRVTSLRRIEEESLEETKLAEVETLVPSPALL